MNNESSILTRYQDRFYVISMEFPVAEAQTFLLAKRVAVRSKEKRLCSQATKC